MATFHFRLATLLKLRESERGQRQLEAAQAQEAERLLQRQAADIGQEIDRMKTRARAAAAPGDVPVDALLEMQRYTLQLKSQATLAAQQMISVRAEVERRRKTLLDADRQVRTLEKLRDHQAATFQQDALHREQKVFDEIAQQRFIQERPRETRMKIVKKLFGWLASAFTLICVVTVAAQVTSFAVASSKGLLSPEKLTRYAGILYGLDPLDLAPTKQDSQLEPNSHTREEILAQRVRATSTVAERIAMITRDAEDVSSISAALKRNREKYAAARDGFESLLNELEKEAEATAIRELQVTMEITSPKQAKEILIAMLTSATADKADGVRADVTQVIRTMPDDQLRKLLAEFKTENERVVLHRLLLEIGELNVPTSLATGAQP